ncbi:hypothetical protein E2C01_097953 [Portunus trituberculatus]|uniref:Uncharacterized protein n=1 Tax=Portunus trituberculatus TaxID=210409 RepID=A0A5B7KCR0_PORTR|nr:hypothetical protein [Portunus trituberculatus]
MPALTPTVIIGTSTPHHPHTTHAPPSVQYLILSTPVFRNPLPSHHELSPKATGMPSRVLKSILSCH